MCNEKYKMKHRIIKRAQFFSFVQDTKNLKTDLVPTSKHIKRGVIETSTILFCVQDAITRLKRSTVFSWIILSYSLLMLLTLIL